MAPVVVTLFNLMFAMFLNNRHSHANALSHSHSQHQTFGLQQRVVVQQQQKYDETSPFEL